MKLSLLFVASLSLVGCKKKESAPPAPAAGSAAVVAPAAGSSAPAAASETPAAAADTPAAPTGARPDCVMYAKQAKTCGHGLRDEATIADECERALSKNTVMAGSIQAQIACAKADPACDAFNKCLAKH